MEIIYDRPEKPKVLKFSDLFPGDLFVLASTFDFYEEVFVKYVHIKCTGGDNYNPNSCRLFDGAKCSHTPETRVYKLSGTLKVQLYSES